MDDAHMRSVHLVGCRGQRCTRGDRSPLTTVCLQRRRCGIHRFQFRASVSDKQNKVVHVHMLFNHQGCMCGTASHSSDLCVDRPALCPHLSTNSFEGMWQSCRGSLGATSSQQSPAQTSWAVTALHEPLGATRSHQSPAQPSWAVTALQTSVCASPRGQRSQGSEARLWT